MFFEKFTLFLQNRSNTKNTYCIFKKSHLSQISRKNIADIYENILIIVIKIMYASYLIFGKSGISGIKYHITDFII